MPLKTHSRQNHKKHPKHYAKVYWPYLPLVLILGLGLFLGQSSATRSQKDVLAYATNVSQNSLLEATNQQRIANGGKALSINPKLNQAAQAKAEDMAKRNYWAHNTPEGNEPWVFFQQAGYNYQKAGENLAYGFISSKDTVAGWMNSPTHRENMLDSSFQEVGFGIANAANYQGAGQETIIVAEYGLPPNNGSAVSIPVSTDQETSQPQVVNSERTHSTEPATTTINKAQALTGGKAPWITFAIGVLCGAGALFLILKNGLRLRKAFAQGEKFVLHHPILDLTIISFLALSAILLQGVGVIR